MAKITEAPLAGPLTGAETMPIVQDGDMKRVPFDTVLDTQMAAVGAAGDAKIALATEQAAIATAAAATAQEATGYKGKSARFPVRNRHNGDDSPFACIAQPTANMGTWLGADGALIMLVTIPRERLRASTSGQSNVGRTIMGNVMGNTGANMFNINLGGASGVYQSGLGFYMRTGVTTVTTSVLIPESYGSRMLMAFRRTSNTFAMDVWDCDTGTKYALNSQDVTAFAGLNPATFASYFQIGAGGNTNTEPYVPPFSPTLQRAWEGDIGFVGYYNAALDDTACQNIALGMAVETATTPATWKWARELDGSVASLTTPSWATGDTTSAATVISSGNLEVQRGSSITAKGTYFTIDRKVAGDAHVDAVVPGTDKKAVALSGKVRSTLPVADDIEVRFLTTEGRAVTDWQKVATIAPLDTTWSGTAIVPKGTERMVRQARLASQRSDPTKWFLDASRFAVGYRIKFFGQSQVDNLRAGSRALQYKGKLPISYIEQAANAATDISAINCFTIHDRMPSVGDGIYGIMAGLEAAGCDAVVALECQAVGGTSALDWINDSLATRAWTPMLRSNEVMDGGTSVVVWNWDAADIAVNYADLLNGVFCGTGVRASNHYVFGALTDGGVQTGATMVYMPTLRTNGGGTTEADSDAQESWGTRRDEGVAWAATKPFAIVGPAPVDMELTDQFHPSLALASGIERQGRHLAFGVLRGTRQDVSTNPTVSGSTFAFTDGTRVAFTFEVTLPNFGRLTNGLGATSDTGADKGVRLIEVSSDGGTTWTKSGFTAVLSGRNKVTVTKTSGSWAAGLKVRVGFGGVGAYGLPTSGITSGNVAARDYWMYDGYSRHSNGLGVPVLPTNTIYSVAG